MADLEAVLADVSYLMAMEKSKSTPAARASKKIVLPDPRKAGRGRRRCVVINASLGGDDDATNLVIHVRHDDDP
ncbi:hypothetical protein HPB52_003295 [Rhipicephalus sanguineus]|uniref:Uncharacterized protein n=1 Tax=Rhipicephalus sanguineus TaxID=34632 RepID=A0A9D4PTT0_RHISA|nr:hypothetical protein HPB52_003295 [Rhipicephalus sanguineus]